MKMIGFPARVDCPLCGLSMKQTEQNEDLMKYVHPETICPMKYCVLQER